jgi:hypothetical protein
MEGSKDFESDYNPININCKVTLCTFCLWDCLEENTGRGRFTAKKIVNQDAGRMRGNAALV